MRAVGTVSALFSPYALILVADAAGIASSCSGGGCGACSVELDFSRLVGLPLRIACSQAAGDVASWVFGA